MAVVAVRLVHGIKRKYMGNAKNWLEKIILWKLLRENFFFRGRGGIILVKIIPSEFYGKAKELFLGISGVSYMENYPGF